MKKIEHWKNLSLDNIVEEIDGIIYEEKWKPLADCESEYEISDFGRVKSLERIIKRNGYMISKERMLRQFFDKYGYLTVSIHYNNTKRRKRTVHRMVAELFIENIFNKPIVHHVFNIKTDNRAVRLKWVTNRENIQDAYDSGIMKGSPKYFKVTPKQVMKIFLDKRSNNEIAKSMKLSRSIVYSIKTGRNWCHITNKKYEK